MGSLGGLHTLLLLAALSDAPCTDGVQAGHFLYCKHCGAPILACDELERVPSPLARVCDCAERVHAAGVSDIASHVPPG